LAAHGTQAAGPGNIIVDYDRQECFRLDAMLTTYRRPSLVQKKCSPGAARMLASWLLISFDLAPAGYCTCETPGRRGKQPSIIDGVQALRNSYKASSSAAQTNLI